MHWRYTANQLRIGPVDASSIMPLFLVLIWPAKDHISFQFIWWGSLSMMVFLAYLGYRGYTPINALRLWRAKTGEWIGRGTRPIHSTYQQWKTRNLRSTTSP